jgi:hypothetical protein
VTRRKGEITARMNERDLRHGPAVPCPNGTAGLASSLTTVTDRQSQREVSTVRSSL